MYGLEEKVEEARDSFDGLSYSAEASKERAEKIKAYSKELGLPSVSVSGAHTLKNIGKGYIVLPDIDVSSERDFLDSLKTNIKNRNFSSVCEFATPLENLGWKVPLGLYAIAWESGVKKLFGVKYKLKK